MNKKKLPEYVKISERGSYSSQEYELLELFRRLSYSGKVEEIIKADQILNEKNIRIYN